jgi:HNH endonuclease
MTRENPLQIGCVEIEVDHVMPLSLGGDDSLVNLTLASTAIDGKLIDSQLLQTWVIRIFSSSYRNYI